MVTTAPQLYLTWIGTLSYTHFHLTCMRFIKSPGKMWSSPPRSVGSNGLSHSNKTWFTIITFNVHLLLGGYGMDWCCSCSSMRWSLCVQGNEDPPTLLLHTLPLRGGTANCYKMKLQHSDISLSTQHVSIPFPRLRTTNLLHLISHREGEKDFYAWILPNNQLLWIYNVKACP